MSFPEMTTASSGFRHGNRVEQIRHVNQFAVGQQLRALLQLGKLAHNLLEAAELVVDFNEVSQGQDVRMLDLADEIAA